MWRYIKLQWFVKSEAIVGKKKLAAGNQDERRYEIPNKCSSHNGHATVLTHVCQYSEVTVHCVVVILLDDCKQGLTLCVF